MLTKVLLSTAINMPVNDEVSKVYESISNKPGKYLTLTPAQRFEVGKRAAEHGVTAAALACFDYESSGFPSSLLQSSSSPRVWGRSISTYTHGSL